ncbi:hypothetical protein JTB14_003515 [Gonioctena quinquepunctata]|nr:hypothetical protein JTB14_003515 [Gonioctena quinquepunctata]
MEDSQKIKQTAYITGDNNSIGVKGVPKLPTLHVDTSTTEQDLAKLLKPHFPEVLSKEKQLLEEKEAKRKEHFDKKKLEKKNKQENVQITPQRENKQENVQITPQKKLLGKRPSLTDALTVEESMIPDKNTRTEPRTLERNAPLDNDKYESCYHLGNRLDELQKRIHDRALELTENTMKNYEILNPNLKGKTVNFQPLQKDHKGIEISNRFNLLVNEELETPTEEHTEEVSRTMNKPKGKVQTPVASSKSNIPPIVTQGKLISQPLVDTLKKAINGRQFTIEHKRQSSIIYAK